MITADAIPTVRESDEHRFWEKVLTPNADGCMLWTGATSRGYGRFKLGPKTVAAHRLAYALLVGPLPDALVLDHVKARGCRSTRCVNVLHLEPVTQQENTVRGMAGAVNAARQKAITHCPAGHEYDRLNTYVSPKGKRGCRACRNRSSNQYKAHRKVVSQ